MIQKGVNSNIPTKAEKVQTLMNAGMKLADACLLLGYDVRDPEVSGLLKAEDIFSDIFNPKPRKTGKV